MNDLAARLTIYHLQYIDTEAKTNSLSRTLLVLQVIYQLTRSNTKLSFLALICERLAATSQLSLWSSWSLVLHQSFGYILR
jgi:hypothetical protein